MVIHAQKGRPGLHRGAWREVLAGILPSRDDNDSLAGPEVDYFVLRVFSDFQVQDPAILLIYLLITT